MKKKILLSLLITCLILTGCNEKKNETKEVAKNTETKETSKNTNSNSKNDTQTKTENNKQDTKKNIKIEDYTGMNYLEIKSKLELEGLNVIVEKTEQVDDLFSENMVARQSIHPSSTAYEGDTITLYIPDIVKHYPNFTDGTYNLSDIQSFCNKYGIILQIEDDPASVQGKITYQSKEAGTSIIHNETLVIKKGIK